MEDLKKSFCKTLGDFVGEMKSVFPELVDKFKVNPEESDESKVDGGSEEIVSFTQQIMPRAQLLAQKDDGFFDTPFFVYTVDVSELFRGASKQNKDAIWKYIQSLFLLASSMNEHVDESINTILKDFMDIINDETSNASPSFDPMDDIYGSFLKGTQIGKLAEDISKKMDIDKLAKDLNIDPSEKTNMTPPNIQDIMSILGGKDGKLMNMVQTVSEEIQSKMESGELNQDIMMKEVQDMMKKFTTDPAFKTVMQSNEMRNMMQSPDLKKMFSGLNAGGVNPMNLISGQNGQNGQDDDFQVLENMFQGNQGNQKNKKNKKNRETSTRDRLLAKLEDRKKKQIKD
jgi:hypothetical protein